MYQGYVFASDDRSSGKLRCAASLLEFPSNSPLSDKLRCAAYLDPDRQSEQQFQQVGRFELQDRHGLNGLTVWKRTVRHNSFVIIAIRCQGKHWTPYYGIARTSRISLETMPGGTHILQLVDHMRDSCQHCRLRIACYSCLSLVIAPLGA